MLTLGGAGLLRTRFSSKFALFHAIKRENRPAADPEISTRPEGRCSVGAFLCAVNSALLAPPASMADKIVIKRLKVDSTLRMASKCLAGACHYLVPSPWSASSLLLRLSHLKRV